MDDVVEADKCGCVEFIRCECGAEWRHTLNWLDSKPVWCPPKAKRGATCQHKPEQAEALIDGEWVKVNGVS